MLRSLLRRQEGTLLLMAIIAAAVSTLIVIPTALLVSSASRNQGNIGDLNREYYLIDAAVKAVIEDLIRGADGDPLAPNDYIPPVVNFDNSVPLVSIQDLHSAAQLTTKVVGTELVITKSLGVDRTVGTTRFVDYRVGAQPVVISGANPLGGVAELAEDDGSYYRLSAAGNSQQLSYQASSETIGFSSLEFAEVKVKLRSWEETTKVEVFVFNGNLANPWVPYTTNLLDHHHALDADLDVNHKHGTDHESEAHNHDAVNDLGHGHGTGAANHDHKDHHHHDHVITDDVDHHEDAHDLHHGHHDDPDHEDDPLHGHHGHFGHDHHHDQGKNADHHHDGEHLLLHNHPDDHVHHGHAGKDKHHHGEETLSLILLKPEIDYLNLPGTTTLDIKMQATVFNDLDHHHEIEKHVGPNEESKGQSPDHIHHSNRLDPPAFNIETDQILFSLMGLATTDQRLVPGEPVVTLGSLVSGTGGDLQFDDTSY